MSKPFLILQLRPEDEAADGEFDAFLEKGEIGAADVHRIRLDQDGLPGDLDLSAYAGVVVGGGPGCVSDDPETRDPDEARIEAAILSLMPRITEEDIPFMGCCYGISILAHHLGAEVSKRRWGEPIGPVAVTMTDAAKADPMLSGFPDSFTALVGHKEATQELPEGCVHLLQGETCPFQMIRHGQNVYATQFHPEADGPIFADRIRIYSGRGYFEPEEADELTRKALSSHANVAPKLLSRFFERYRGK